MNADHQWTVYRTRFLVRARKLTAPLFFIDALGREHSGDAGDYLVESSDGLRRIAPRNIFEDIYVPLDSTLPPRKPALPSSTGSASVRQSDASSVHCGQDLDRHAPIRQSVVWSG